MRRTIVAFASLLFVACGGDGSTADAGTDAAAPDGGGAIDAGPPDAGAVDAGSSDASAADAAMVDGGPPSVQDLGATVMSDVTNVQDAVAAVPVMMRVGDAFLQVDVGTAGLNAIIGENGLQTLALSEATIRALADLRQANVLIDLLTQASATFGASSDPMEMAIHDQLVPLIASLTAYRDGLARLYRERLGVPFVGTPVVQDMFYENTWFSVDGTPNQIEFVIEGQSSAMASSSLDVICSDSLDVTVIREDTGETLASDSGPDGSVTLDVPVPYDTPTAVRVTVTTPLVGGMWSSCGASMTTRRSLQTDPVPYDVTAGSPYMTAKMTWDTAVTDAETAYDATGTAGTPAAVLAVVQEELAMLFDLMAPFLSSDALPTPVETIQRANRRMVYVAAMLDALAASPVLVAADASSSVPDAVTNVKTAAQGILTAITP